MANDFYNHSSSIAAGATARADQVRGEFDEIAAGFDLVQVQTDRAIRMPVGAEFIITETAENRAGKAVAFDQDGAGTLTALGAFRGDWATLTAYAYKDIVRAPSANGYNLYICDVAHTSGTFATDVSAGKFTLLADLRLVVNELKTSSFTAVAGGDYMVDSSSASVGTPLDITLPASPAITDAPITITHVKGDASTVRVLRNGKLIMELAENMTVDTQYAAFRLMFCNDALGWRVSL